MMIRHSGIGKTGKRVKVDLVSIFGHFGPVTTLLRLYGILISNAEQVAYVPSD